MIIIAITTITSSSSTIILPSQRCCLGPWYVVISGHEADPVPLLCSRHGWSRCTSEEVCEPHVVPTMMYGFFFVFPPCPVLYLAGVLTCASPLSRGWCSHWWGCSRLLSLWLLSVAFWSLLLPRLVSLWVEAITCLDFAPWDTGCGEFEG